MNDENVGQCAFPHEIKKIFKKIEPKPNQTGNNDEEKTGEGGVDRPEMITKSVILLIVGQKTKKHKSVF